ncbi:unnamed protein product [Acanthoscelides obtectus]|uniref:Uncharacterized protein n=1 Tax=Acanthoscelides obtectus TaxID=200917 RepID=A0A9P0L3K9_ACAOB|nr:unnamed protein product [Acanthoscelides obtectus]CAK1673115.1 hypothetical protein AOBTE_LOCUS29243 [Acanthoscelides obtectus]
MERIFLLLMLLQSAICHPKTREAFDLQNISPPEEINRLSYDDFNQPAHSFNYNNMDSIIVEVEKLISSQRNLPRLTRGEILDLLENITASDLEQYQHDHIDSLPRGRNPKAYMVVKAYSPEENEAGRVEELYTKTPVTQIVADQHVKEVGPSEGKDSTTGLNKKIHRGRKRTTTTTSAPIIDTSTTDIETFPDITDERFHPSTSSEKPATVTHHRRRRPTPARDLNRTRKVSSTTDTPITTYSSRRRRPVMRTTSTTTEQYANHRYSIQEEGNRIPSSSLPFGEKDTAQSQHQDDPYSSNDDLIMMENSRKEIPLALTRTTKAPSYYTRSSTSNPEIEPFVPQEGIADQASSYSDILSTKLSYQPAPSYIADLDTAPAEHIAVSRATSTSAPSTTVPDISPVADNLSSEMRDLLVSFGLIQGPKPIEDVKKDDTYNPEKAEVDPGSYVGFKPLPVNNDESRSDMDLLLARFGLGRNSKNQLPQSAEKRSDEDTDGTVILDVVPEQYQGVLEDIGLPTRQGKKIRTEPLTKTLEKTNEYTPPKANSNAQEIEKLNKLLNIIQKIEKLNKTLSNDDTDNEQLREVVESLNVDTKVTPLNHQNAPNPLNYDDGLSKNEIKRQQNTKDAAEAKADQEQVQVVTPTVKLNVEETISVSASTPAKEETATPNIKDLEDSFGGKTDPPTEPPATEAATKRTGFYYLVDWNTFLEVDDQKGKRVNLRFQPTIGDPKRFYSVSVP